VVVEESSIVVPGTPDAPTFPDTAVVPGPVPPVTVPETTSRPAASPPRPAASAVQRSTATLVGSTLPTPVPPVVQRTASSPVTPTSGATPAPAPTTPPATSRSTIRSLPLQRMFSGAMPTPQAVSLPVRPPAADPTGRATTFATDHVETTSDVAVPVTWEAPTPTVQRAESGETPAPGDDSTPATETPSDVGVATALGSTPPRPAKPGGQDLDELARRLYGPVSAMLRAELWLDRERSGRSFAR
jgi:hypothetical protein